MSAKDQVLDVWGDLACFSRPEMKVERFSYPIITPSAARGIYDAIYCKPIEFRWQIIRVEIFTEPSYIALRRNEVKDKVPPERTISRWMAGKETPVPIWADGDKSFLGTDQKGRTQRQTMALKNVRYRLHAEIWPWPGFESKLTALEMQFRRRAAGGKCIYQPYLGCREFPAWFELVEVGASPILPAPLDIKIGWMLYDVFDLSRPGRPEDPPCVSLFQAEVCQGVMEVPIYESDLVYKSGEGGR